MLHFYVERVFRSYTSSQPQDERILSSLANTFIIIRKDMHKCVSHLRRETGGKQVGQAGVITTSSCVQHCLCEEPTQKRVDALQQAFNQVREQKRYRTGTSSRGMGCTGSGRQGALKRPSNLQSFHSTTYSSILAGNSIYRTITVQIYCFV